MKISVQHADFDSGVELEGLLQDCAESATSPGALVSMVGLVRDHADAHTPPLPIQSMLLEHYPGMTEQALAEIAKQAQRRWPLLQIRIIHRIGLLPAGDKIVFVGVAAAHRHAAFAACEFIMDYLKTKAPFWKKEFNDIGSQWVTAKDSDDEALKRW